jgi:AhpD family alkylhydroperoxidase
MENSDKEKIERIIKTRKQANSYFSKKSEVYRLFCEMEDKTYEAGSLSVKQKRLIEVGIAVAINCESCMEWSIKQALDNGASTEEIIEAIEIAIEMRGGPATAYARFAMNVIEYHTQPDGIVHLRGDN